MEAILKEVFRELALKTRYERGLTQSKMSRALVMSERSYEDIERGKTGCGALTVVLLLMEIDNPICNTHKNAGTFLRAGYFNINIICNISK